MLLLSDIALKFRTPIVLDGLPSRSVDAVRRCPISVPVVCIYLVPFDDYDQHIHTHTHVMTMMTMMRTTAVTVSKTVVAATTMTTTTLMTTTTAMVTSRR